MSKETLFMLASISLALVIVPASYMFSDLDTLENTPVFKQFGMLSVASGCSFLVYFLAIHPKIRQAFIGGASLTSGAIQAWAIYGVLLSQGDPKGAIALLQIYLLSSLGLLVVSTIWVFVRPRWIYPEQGSAVKYALFGSSTTVINYFIILFIFYILTR